MVGEAVVDVVDREGVVVAEEGGEVVGSKKKKVVSLIRKHQARKRRESGPQRRRVHSEIKAWDDSIGCSLGSRGLSTVGGQNGVLAPTALNCGM